MAFALTWMPGVLLETGLKVAEDPGWQGRGRSEMGQVLGVMIHHTATAATAVGNMPTLRTLRDGRADLPGPLSQLGLGRDGTWYVIAAGRANHAGQGMWRGFQAGNTHFIGVECEHSGKEADMPWPEIQMRSLRQGVAALLKHIGRSTDWCMGHKEFALPAGRKPDPLFEMDTFRLEVAALMSSGVQPLPLIPAVEPAPVGGMNARPTLRRGSAGPLVRQLQHALGIAPDDGIFGPRTEAGVREFQRAAGLVPDGIVGPKSWAHLPKVST